MRRRGPGVADRPPLSPGLPRRRGRRRRFDGAGRASALAPAAACGRVERDARRSRRPAGARARDRPALPCSSAPPSMLPGLAVCRHAADHVGAAPRARPGSHSASAAMSSSVIRHVSSSVSRACTMRVLHHGVVDRVAVLVECRPHRQAPGCRPRDGCMPRTGAERPGGDRPDPSASTRHGHLDARIRREVRDQPAAVQDVGHDPRGLPGDDRMDDDRRVLAAPLDLERLASIEHAASSPRTRRGCARRGAGIRRWGCGIARPRRPWG